MLLLGLLSFSTVWITIIYGANCLIVRKFLPVKIPQMSIYVLTMAALGLFGEAVFDTVYKLVLGQPLWEYHLLPIHNGYTSIYSLYLWGTIGLHLYLLHESLRKRGIQSVHILALIFCLEAILLEALVNISHLAIFGSYIYYYLPTDLWHITSVQTLPLYLLAGYITVLAMRFANQLPRSALVGNTLVLTAILTIK